MFATAVLLFRPAAPRVGRRAAGRSGGEDLLAVALAASCALTLCAFGSPRGEIAATAAVCAAGTATWVPFTRRWSVRALLCWSATVLAGAVFLVYAALWTVTSGLTPIGVAGGTLLWLLELCTYLLGLAYLWELADVLGSRRWSRRTPEPVVSCQGGGVGRFVSVHVPTHNEPPEMVIETLRSLLALDYADFEVLVLDNNTDDEALWRPVERFCGQHPDVLRFHHLANWPGYKSGALNFGLGVTDGRAELIAVVDADYLVEPDWLRRTTPLFDEPRLGYVQSPQDYREWTQSRYLRRLYHSYDYFFRVSQRSRDERDAAIFGGTMGLIRRAALEEAGGWDEWCITEDAELSLRLNRAGWSGRQVDHSFGHGIMPLTFEALKSQRFRWRFGGIQLLRMHWRSLLPWDRDPSNHLSSSQRLAYLCGGLQWFGELLSAAMTALLLAGGVDAAFGGDVIIRRLSPVLLMAIPAIATLAIVRAVGGIRRAGHATAREALGALGIWAALSWTVARACVRGAIEPAGVFLRTPKTRSRTSLTESMRLNRTESAVGVAGLFLAIVLAAWHHADGNWLIIVLLVVTSAGYLAAPLNSLAALRTDLSRRLRRRRATESARAWSRLSNPRARRRAGLTLGACVAATATLVLLAPNVATDSLPTPHHSSPGLVDGLGKPQSPATSAQASVSTAAPSTTAATEPPAPAPTQAETPDPASPRPAMPASRPASMQTSPAGSLPSSRPASSTASRPAGSPTRATTSATATTEPTTVATTAAPATRRTTPAAATRSHGTKATPTRRPTAPPGKA